MANTVIALKKSSTPSAEPTTLANGELAINFADGKLFYKNSTGQIVSFTSGSNSFGTVNANGTLIISDTVGDVLTIEAGNNISIVGDAINDKVTIGLQNDITVPGTIYVKSVGGNEGGEIQLGNAVTNSVLSGNVVIDIYQNQIRFFESSGSNRGAYINLASAGTAVGTDLLAAASSTDSTARAAASAAYDKANSANVLAFNTGIGANAFTSATIAGANNISIAAFNKANAALPNTSGVSFAGNLNFPTGNVSIGISSPGTKFSVFGSSNSGITTVTDNTSIVLDMTSNNNFAITLGGSNTFINPTTMNPGQSGVIWISQDSGGSRAPSWGSYWRFPSNTAPTLSTAANSVDAIVYVVRNSTSITAQAILNVG